MAKLGDLVVRIGADTRDLNKSLGRVQRNMRSMTSNFTALGQTMTRSLTLPLAAFGAAAVKSAADLEKLETSFISLTGGAAEAAAMMKQLNEFTANTPFQIDAVAKAARQLIASGTEVSQVNQQLQFLGDIAATSGTSIDEIAAIFAKVNAKGKVELENLNQLAERGIPIFKALAEATGLPADALGAGAVSVEQFNQVLQGFAEQGGFAEGAMDRLSKTAAGRFSTALDNAKIALANVGEQVLPLVNEGLQKFTTLMQGFAQLSPGTLKLAAAIAGIAASIGPMITVLPKLIALVTALKTSFLLTTPAILGVAAVAGTLIGLFTRIAKEAKTSKEEVKGVQTAIEDLSKAGLAAELGVSTGASRSAVLDAIAWSTGRLTEANDALAKIEEKIQKGGAGLRTVYANKIKDITEYRDEMQRMVDAGQRLLTFFEVQTTRTRQAAKAMSTLTAATIDQNKANKQLQVTTWNVGDLIETATDKTTALGESLVNAFANAGRQAKDFADLLRIVTIDIVQSFLRQAAARQLALGNLPAAIGLAVASGVTGRAGIPAMASGGVVYGPTMALVGDNKNARIDPEVVAPLSKLRDMMGGNQVEVFGRISGNDIFLSNSRTGTSRNRYA